MMPQNAKRSATSTPAHGTFAGNENHTACCSETEGKGELSSPWRTVPNYGVPMMKNAAGHPPEPPWEAGRPRWSTADIGGSGRGRSASAVSASIARSSALA